MAKKSNLLQKFNDNPELVDGWKVLDDAKVPKSHCEDINFINQFINIDVTNKALNHANKGDFTFNPSTNEPLRMKGGGHGQDNIDILNTIGFKFNIVRTYDNGVRVGNVAPHKSRNKRTGIGQSWFPSN